MGTLNFRILRLRSNWEHRRPRRGWPNPTYWAEIECGKKLAFTANNIGYAGAGDLLKYWNFFPTEQG
ncbi:MAG: DUF2855 family protein [Gammaproteobacteria bacterium]